MKLITATPIYRNRFLQPKMFFSKQDFSVGSVCFVPLNKKEKPAIIIESDDLEKKKFLLRKNKIQIEKISNEKEIPIFKAEQIKNIKLAESKTNYIIEEILQKIISKKIIQELNKLTPASDDIKNIKKFVEKIDLDYLRKKIKKTVKQKKEVRGGSEFKTINTILSKTKIQEKTSIHSEIHYLTNEIRTYFGETARKGKGSFGFYLGFFNRVPKHIIYEYWSDVKSSRKPLAAQQKIFWWKIGQYLKEKKVDNKK